MSPSLPERQNMQGIKNAAIAATIIGEVTPVNEALRASVFMAGQLYLKDPLLVAASVGVATMAIEGSAAVATAAALHSTAGKRVTEKINEKLSSSKLERLLETNPLTEAAIGLTMGSAVAEAVKHRQYSERTIEEDRRYGLKAALGISAISMYQAYAVSKGLEEISATNIAGIAIATGIAVAAVSKIRNQRNMLSEIERSKEYYQANMNSNLLGPQKEGIPLADLQEVFEDPRTEYVTLNDKKSKRLWPLLTPIENNSEYRTEYFSKEEIGKTYYLSVPKKTEDIDWGSVNEQMEVILRRLSEKEVTIVFDFLESSKDTNLTWLEDRITSAGCVTAAMDDMKDEKNDTSASVQHFEGLMHSGAAEDRPSLDLRETYLTNMEGVKNHEEVFEGSVLLNPYTIDLPASEEGTTMDRLWAIYSKRFTDLVENHPARQAQTYEELKSMISDPRNLTIAYKHKGEIVTFAVLSDVNACDWLNTQYYTDKFSDENVYYFPGIATDPEKQGNNYSLQVISLVTEIFKNSQKSCRIVFQCTNISADYIPKIIETGASLLGVDLKVNEMDRYSYRSVVLNRSGHVS